MLDSANNVAQTLEISQSSDAKLMLAAQGGDRRALAKFLTRAENQAPGALACLKNATPSQSARVIGLTGPPGAGKSTLVNQIISHIRSTGKTVAVIAIDPSSPFSGGALLGDRIRMQQHNGDSGVYIRSVASRGAHGGMAHSVYAMVEALKQTHFDVILIETVGVGQTEIEIVNLAETVVVVLVPESGDTVQAMKAGLMEIADVFVVNKADRPGAEKMALELGLLTEGSSQKKAPEVFLVSAEQSKGIDEFMSGLDRHQQWMTVNPHRVGERRVAQFRELLRYEWFARFCETAVASASYQRVAHDVAAGRISPFVGALQVLEDEQ